MQDKECEEEFERMAAQGGYAMDRYKMLGAGGHANTYRSDADSNWGLLAPLLLPRGWKHG